MVGSVKLVDGCSLEGTQSRDQPSVGLTIVTVNPVELPELVIVLDGILIICLFDILLLSGVSYHIIYKNYFSYRIYFSIEERYFCFVC